MAGGNVVDAALWIALSGVGALIVALGAVQLWRQLFGDNHHHHPPPPPRR